MPRFHFHVDDGANLRDHEGTELADLATAKSEAVKLAGRMIYDGAAEFWEAQGLRLTVSDDAGLNLFRINCSGFDEVALNNPFRAGADTNRMSA